MPDPLSYLALRRGPFRLAVRTDAVLGVLAEVVLRPDEAPTGGGGAVVGRLDLGGAVVAAVDFAAAAAGGASRRAYAFAVAIEVAGDGVRVGGARAGGATAGTVAVLADHIGYLARDQVRRLDVPRFGLHQGDLFESALRTPEALWLALDPAALGRWAVSKTSAGVRQFDPVHTGPV